MARLLAKLDYEWFEAPLPDKDIGQYRELTRESDVCILPAGNWFSDLPRFTQAVETGEHAVMSVLQLAGHQSKSCL